MIAITAQCNARCTGCRDGGDIWCVMMQRPKFEVIRFYGGEPFYMQICLRWWSKPQYATM